MQKQSVNFLQLFDRFYVISEISMKYNDFKFTSKSKRSWVAQKQEPGLGGLSYQTSRPCNQDRMKTAQGWVDRPGEETPAQKEPTHSCCTIAHEGKGHNHLSTWGILKEMGLLCQTPCKVNPKWITVLKVKGKTLKLLEYKISLKSWGWKGCLSTQKGLIIKEKTAELPLLN